MVSILAASVSDGISNQHLNDDEVRNANKSAIVMEMVEAIIDNNYDVNAHQYHRESDSLQTTAARDDQSNLEAASSLREPLKAQMSKVRNNGNQNDKKRQGEGKVRRQGMTTNDDNDDGDAIHILQTFQLTSLSRKHFCRIQ